MEVLIGNVTVILDMESKTGTGIENYVFGGKTDSEIDPWFLSRLKEGIEEARAVGSHNSRRMSVVYDTHGFLIRW
jgi:hypothetical protein